MEHFDIGRFYRVVIKGNTTRNQTSVYSILIFGEVNSEMVPDKAVISKIFNSKEHLPVTITKKLLDTELSELDRRIKLLHLTDPIKAVNAVWSLLVYELSCPKDILIDCLDSIAFSVSPSLFLAKAFLLSLGNYNLPGSTISHPLVDVWNYITLPGDLSAMSQLTETQKKALIVFVKAFMELEDSDASNINHLDNAFDDYVLNTFPELTQRVNFIVQLKNMKIRYKKSLHIIAEALRHIHESARPEDVSMEWLIDFLDYSRKIYSEFKFKLWSEICACELNNPGSISRRLLMTIYLMSDTELLAFDNLRRLCFVGLNCAGDIYPIVFIREFPSAYPTLDVTTNNLALLQFDALIECNYESGFVIEGDANLSYGSFQVFIEGDHNFSDKIKRVNVGNVRFTKYGLEFFNLLQNSEVFPMPRHGDSIFGFTVHHWINKGLKLYTTHYNPETGGTIVTKYNY